MLKLFSSTDTSFNSNGDKIIKAIKATVHKEDNGEFFLEIETGIEYANDIIEGNIVVAPTPQGEQAFRITNPQKTLHKIAAKANHVYYDSENFVILKSDIKKLTCGETLNVLITETDTTTPFVVNSDISDYKDIQIECKTLKEAFNLVLETWGGHIVRDNYNLSIKKEIGVDNGITIRYAKNLKEITCEEDWGEVATKLLPIGSDGIMLNSLNKELPPYIYSDIQYSIPYTKAIEFSQDVNSDNYKDASGKINEIAYKQALIDDLKKQASEYLNKNQYPKINYALKAHINRTVDIGDTIEVIDERLGINLLTNVISYDYDCNLKRYTEIEFGNFKKKLSNLIETITSGVYSKIDNTINLALTTFENNMSSNQSAITANIEEPITDITINQLTKIPLNSSINLGNKLRLTDDGGILIGAGISQVIISGRVAFSATGLKKAVVTNGDEEILTAAETLNTSGNVNIISALINVSDNDILYLNYYTTDSSDNIGIGTSLTVQVV